MLYMKPFINMKAVYARIHFSFLVHYQKCEKMKLFTIYPTQILSNVGHLFIKEDCRFSLDLDFIKYAPTLRQLVYEDIFIESTGKHNRAIKLHSDLENILKNRRNEQNSSDFIEIKIRHSGSFRMFKIINGRNSFIKISKLSSDEDKNLFERFWEYFGFQMILFFRFFMLSNVFQMKTY